MGIAIREATPDDVPFLQRMLFEAVHMPDVNEESCVEEALKDNPDLAQYVQGFGSRPMDLGVLAVDESEEHPVGAAWVRLFGSDEKGLGYLDDKTPELVIAVAPGERGQGIGTRLMLKILQKAKKESIDSISLSCRADDRAMKMYARAGFHKVEGTEFVYRGDARWLVLRAELHHHTT